MLDPIQELMDEHRTIEQVLTALETAAVREVDLAFYEKATDFIVNYADKCHHAKEEDRLFPLMEQKGIPREGGPIGVMCSEHTIGRGYLRRMRELMASGDRKGLREVSLEYVGLLRQHIQKEDNILYPMGRARFEPADLEGLRKAFDEVERAGQYHDRYTGLARELLSDVGIET